MFSSAIRYSAFRPRRRARADADEFPKPRGHRSTGVRACSRGKRNWCVRPKDLRRWSDAPDHLHGERIGRFSVRKALLEGGSIDLLTTLEHLEKRLPTFGRRAALERIVSSVQVIRKHHLDRFLSHTKGVLSAVSLRHDVELERMSRPRTRYVFGEGKKDSILFARQTCLRHLIQSCSANALFSLRGIHSSSSTFIPIDRPGAISPIQAP